MTEHLLVGRVMRPHGLGGEVSVEVLSDFPERFAPGPSLVWPRGWDERPLTLSAVRPHGRRLLITFEGVRDAESARALAGGELAVPKDEAFPAPEGYYYSHEIRGWTCETPEGRRLGTAADLEATPAGPMLSVDTGAGRIALVPFVNAVVRSVVREARRIVLDPPEGWFEL